MGSTRSTRRLSVGSPDALKIMAKASTKPKATPKKLAERQRKTRKTEVIGKDGKVSFNQFAREYPIDICQPPSPPIRNRSKLPLSPKSSEAVASSSSSFGKPSPRTATPKVRRFSDGPLRSNGLGLSFTRPGYKLLFGEASLGQSSQKPRKTQSTTKSCSVQVKSPRYRRASQHRSTKSQFSRPRNISTVAPSPETPNFPSSPQNSDSPKTISSVRAMTVQKAERVVKRQRNLTRRISELSRLLLEVIDQVHDVERAVGRAEEDVEWEAAEVRGLCSGGGWVEKDERGVGLIVVDVR